ncbi:MAG: hypothetical protein P4L84_05350 [Isosphaeraceae bacterium]|nr:hypothetical protein [Isosphaeraceae bacterium]
MEQLGSQQAGAENKSMGQAEIKRIREDLETIREAAGMGLPFGWEDVWLNLALVPCGLILSTAGAFGPPESRMLMAMPGLGAVVAVVCLRYRFRRSTGRSPVRRREYDLALGAGLLYGVVAGVFLAWTKSSGLPTRMTGGVATAMAGALCAVLAATSPGRRYWSAAALVLIAYGLVHPLCSPRQLVVAGGAAMAVSGLLAAAIQAGQLRRGNGS